MCKLCQSPLENRFHEAWLKEKQVSDLILEPQYQIHDYPQRFVDFAIVQLKIAIEIDSKQFHSTEEQIRNDKEREIFLRKEKHWHFIRLYGPDVYSHADEMVRLAYSNILHYHMGMLMALGNRSIFRQALQIFGKSAQIIVSKQKNVIEAKEKQVEHIHFRDITSYEEERKQHVKRYIKEQNRKTEEIKNKEKMIIDSIVGYVKPFIEENIIYESGSCSKSLIDKRIKLYARSKSIQYSREFIFEVHCELCKNAQLTDTGNYYHGLKLVKMNSRKNPNWDYQKKIYKYSISDHMK